MPLINRHRSARGGTLAGCLIALAVVAILLVIGGVLVVVNLRSWTASGMRSAMDASLNKSTLPEQEKAEIQAVVDQFCDEFEAGDISYGDFGKVFERLAQSPVLPAIVVESVNAEYIQASELSDEEKAAGSKELSRFVRGVFEGSISQTKIDDVTEPIAAAMDDPNKVAIHSGNLNIELKQSSDVTPEELKAFLANAKAEADAAGVPDEAFQIDWSAELQRAIDQALGRAPELTEPAESPAPADPAEPDADGEQDAEASDEEEGG